MITINKNEIKTKILYKSLIGKEIEVVFSTNKKNVGILGIIIYESQNEFHIKTKNGIKKLTKKNIKFNLKYENNIFEIDGEILSNSLCERLKKKK